MEPSLPLEIGAEKAWWLLFCLTAYHVCWAVPRFCPATASICKAFSVITRTIKEPFCDVPLAAERTGERQGQPIVKDKKNSDSLSAEGSNTMEFNDLKTEANGDGNSGLQAQSKKLNNSNEFPTEVNLAPIPRQGSWKQLPESRPLKNPRTSARKLTVVSQSSANPKWGNKKHLHMINHCACKEGAPLYSFYSSWWKRHGRSIGANNLMVTFQFLLYDIFIFHYCMSIIH